MKYKFAKFLLAITIGFFTFLFLVIDRLSLVLFVNVTAYGAKELAEMPAKFSAHSVMRVAALILIFLIVLTLKWLL